MQITIKTPASTGSVLFEVTATDSEGAELEKSGLSDAESVVSRVRSILFDEDLER